MTTRKTITVEALAAFTDAALDKYLPGSHPDLAQAIAEFVFAALPAEPAQAFSRSDPNNVYWADTPLAKAAAEPAGAGLREALATALSNAAALVYHSDRGSGDYGAGWRDALEAVAFEVEGIALAATPEEE